MADTLVIDRIELARRAILAQIEERDRDFPHERPAPPWDKCAKAMSYVFRLPVEDLRSVRLHCDLFLGENTPQQIFAHGVDVPGYQWLGEGIASQFWASEPEIACFGEPIGTRFADKRITRTTVLLQRYLCNLLRLGLRDGQHVVEIGAGYGGLAEAILKARHVRYTIIDLPETLIYSAAFLMEHFPEKSVYVYRPGDDENASDGADLVLLPNYRADLLQRCDVAVNTVSFPEMSREALCGYLSLLRARLTPEGFLMSVNYEFNPARQDERFVSDFLADHFKVSPMPQGFDADLKDVNFRPTLVCSGNNQPSAELRDIILGQRVVTQI